MYAPVYKMFPLSGPSSEYGPVKDIYMKRLIYYSSPESSNHLHHLRAHPAVLELSFQEPLVYPGPPHYSKPGSWDIIWFTSILIILFIVALSIALRVIYIKYKKYHEILPPDADHRTTDKKRLLPRKFKGKKMSKLSSASSTVTQTSFINAGYGSLV